MIQPDAFLTFLSQNGVSFYTGVPDSLLKSLTAAISQHPQLRHLIAANEGAALAVAAGYHLATNKIASVYLQNSGLGNLVNPLTSLADKQVYGLPLLLLIGWRGEPGLPDEPQHSVMGQITPALLSLLQIPFAVLKKQSEWKADLTDLLLRCRKENRPVALLVEAGVFLEKEGQIETHNNYELSSETAIRLLCRQLCKDDAVICTTGKIGRVFYKINNALQTISRYFLNVGSMGHALSIAAGIALNTEGRVVVLDGDGALLMHLGALALVPSLQLKNYLYVLLNNGAHQSVGSQPTLGFAVDFIAVARGFGFRNPVRVETDAQLAAVATCLSDFDFLEIRINTYTAEPLPRPQEKPIEAKEGFMKSLGAFDTQ